VTAYFGYKTLPLLGDRRRGGESGRIGGQEGGESKFSPGTNSLSMILNSLLDGESDGFKD